jgi:hypothetical protein
MTRSATRALYAALLCCIVSSLNILPGCLENDRSAEGTSLNPPAEVREAVNKQFPHARYLSTGEMRTRDGVVNLYLAVITHESHTYSVRVAPGKGLVSWEKQLTPEEVSQRVHDSALARVPAGTIARAKELVRIDQGRPVVAGYHLTLRLAEKQLDLRPDGSMDEALDSLQTIGW